MQMMRLKLKTLLPGPGELRENLDTTGSSTLQIDVSGNLDRSEPEADKECSWLLADDCDNQSCKQHDEASGNQVKYKSTKT